MGNPFQRERLFYAIAKSIRMFSATPPKNPVQAENLYPFCALRGTHVAWVETATPGPEHGLKNFMRPMIMGCNGSYYLIPEHGLKLRAYT